MVQIPSITILTAIVPDPTFTLAAFTDPNLSSTTQARYLFIRVSFVKICLVNPTSLAIILKHIVNDHDIVGQNFLVIGNFDGCCTDLFRFFPVD